MLGCDHTVPSGSLSKRHLWRRRVVDESSTADIEPLSRHRPPRVGRVGRVSDMHPALLAGEVQAMVCLVDPRGPKSRLRVGQSEAERGRAR